MNARALFSAHSSNPLEVPTSDPRNEHYRRHVQQLLQHTGPHALSSDDPIAGYHVDEEIANYQQHIRQLFPTMAPAAPRHRAHSFKHALQEPLQYSESEDELEIIHEGKEDMGMSRILAVEHSPKSIVEDAGVEVEPGQAQVPVNDDLVVEDSDHEDACEDISDIDEDMTIFAHPEDERAEIQEEISDLEDVVPQLKEDYKIVDRLGTGTFSSVYKAIDLGYESKWNNKVWHGRNPPESSAHYQSTVAPTGSKFYVAIKRIYVTSNPERVRNEITIMEDCRGCRHVSQLITAFRNRDQVVVIMPYHRNDDFRDYFRSLPMDGIKEYFRCLLRALRDIHSRGVIHRDVKPANFLFDTRTYTGTLCDFGLACRVDASTGSGTCLHTPATRDHPHGQKKSSKHIDAEIVRSMQREARQKSSLPSDRVGYPDKDLRPHSKANRAGTRGFRAPEVLLKCNDQTGAVDIWSVGTILLFFLTGKFPLFQSNDDIEALMEIACIIGRRRMECAATLHARTFATNVPSVARDGMTWRDFVEKNNPNIIQRSSSPSPSTSAGPIMRSKSDSFSTSASLPPPSSLSSDTLKMAFNEAAQTQRHDIELAFDFLEKLLAPESINRITARDALYHPFLAEDCPGDDAFFPHPINSGRCGKYHYIDEDTEIHHVQIPLPHGMIMRPLQAGQGIPIGNRPCEFHDHLDEFNDE